jgi:hypothetical protein
MKKSTIILSVAIASFMATSCSVRLIDFTVISSKNVTLKLPDDGKGPRTTGKDLKTCGQPSLKAAVDKAIETAGPGYDALIDGVVFQKNEIFRAGWVVEGTPIKTSKLKNSN